jgi:hypothetical protein
MPHVIGGLILSGGEIRHIQHHAAGPGHRLLRRRHERPARRIPAQLRCVTQEHPQLPLHKPSRYRYSPAAQLQSGMRPPALVRAHTALAHPAQWAYKTGRAIFDKSHNHLASSARRLVIEAAYSV